MTSDRTAAARSAPCNNSDMRIALVLAAIAATLGSLIALVLTRETWSMIASAFGVGAVIVIARLASAHPDPDRVPRHLRKLGPLPRDPGLRPPPDLSRDPFRE